MKVFWILIFSILLFFNVLYIFCSIIKPLISERRKKSVYGVSRKPCSYLNNEKKCDNTIIKLLRKLKNKEKSACPGAQGCMFYVYEEVETGEMKRSNFVHLMLSAFFSHISAITTLIITVYEIIEKILE